MHKESANPMSHSSFMGGARARGVPGPLGVRDALSTQNALAAVLFAALIGISGMSGLTGCVAPSSMPVLLEAKDIPAGQAEQWAGYGAYYVFDELFVEESFLDAGQVKQPSGAIIVNKQLRILTRDGVAHGSIEVPQYSAFINQHRFSAFDSAGKAVVLDDAAMLANYRKTGKVLFPNVTPGSKLEVYFKFGQPRAITVFEHWFSGAVPVARGRFTFSRLDSYDFDFAEYGPVRKSETAMQKPAERMHYRTWTVSNIRPRARLDFQEEIDAAEPRVSVVMRSYNGFPVISSWEGLSKQYEEEAFKSSFFISSGKLKKKTDQLGQGKTSEEDKAEAIFHFVQDNISYKNSPLRAIDYDRVISSGQGNVWEIAAVLKEMFQHAGLKTEVLVTRPRSMGGFDPKFETPIQLSVPLVRVTAGGRDRLAFPYLRGGALGEYPDDYFGLSALSVSFKDSTSLPEYSAGPSFSRTTYRIDLSQADAGQNMDLEMGGYLAYAIRVALFKQSKTEVTEVFQKILTGYGASNALVRCEVKDQNSRGKPITAKLVFRNPNQVVERKGEMQMRLSHLFPAHFSTYDTSRATGFKNNLESKQVVRLEVAKIPGKRLEATLPCGETDNALFKVTCLTEDTPEAFIFTREVLLRKIRLSAAEIRLLYTQIADLDRIGEGRLVLRDDAIAKEAPKTKKARVRK